MADKSNGTAPGKPSESVREFKARYPDCPLSYHPASDRLCTKRVGRRHCFGHATSPAEVKTAVNKWQKPKRYLRETEQPPAEVHTLRAGATPDFRRMVRLGLNAGFGNRDWAVLRISDIGMEAKS